MPSGSRMMVWNCSRCDVQTMSEGSNGAANEVPVTDGEQLFDAWDGLDEEAESMLWRFESA